jgi:carbamoyl-phosphate synthase/aspartate carbamoyltransferase/dihydroorotase
VRYFKKVNKKVFGLKVYMGKTTGLLLIEETKERELIFKSWTSPLPIMVHVIGDEIKDAINLAKKYKKRLHICHVTGDQIEFIKEAKKEKVEITCEVTPHHLFLQKSDIKKLGPLGLMKPPLEDLKHQNLLWENLKSIDMIATDHAPHTLTEKKEKTPPFGVPGLETALPLMLNAVSEGKLSMDKLIDMMATSPRKIFKLPKQDNTFLLIDYKKVIDFSKMKLCTKCSWTPFAQMRGRGEIKKVVLRGKTVYEKGRFSQKPSGLVIRPKLSSGTN